MIADDITIAAPMETEIRHRVGTFDMDSDLVYRDPASAVVVLAGCIVFRCEHHFYANRLRYEALHPEFDLVPEGEVMPEYWAEITRHDDGTITRKWVRK